MEFFTKKRKFRPKSGNFLPKNGMMKKFPTLKLRSKNGVEIFGMD